MSTVSEMHINIDLELNKINSNLYDIILPEEKDYFLNKAQERFVKDRYGAQSNSKGKGFEMSQKRIDDLRNLLVPNYYDKCYFVASNDFDFDTKLRFYLPNDYWFLTSNRSKVYGSDCGTIVTTSNVLTNNYSLISFNFPSGTTAGFTIQTNPTFPTPPTTILTGITVPIEDIELFKIDLVTRWNSLYATTYGWTFYIDTYKNLSFPGKVIAVSNPVGTALRYVIGETVTNFSLETTDIFNYYTATGGTEAVVTNKFIQQDDIYSLALDPFNSTVKYAPLTIIHDNNIDVFIDKNIFIVKEIAISYIRRPKLISLLLNQSCELAEHTHAEIIRDAVNLMLENFEATARLATSLQVEQTNE